MIAAIQQMLLQEWDHKLLHTLREGNFAADYLAKMGVNCGMRLRLMREIPPDLPSIFLADPLGVSSPRP
ncbi:hypothetical protein P8452_76299 [Trifolium repens]|jgi:hypothetical protein|nr:hypothetical protein P8452_76299 [Trifolium repens]